MQTNTTCYGLFFRKKKKIKKETYQTCEADSNDSNNACSHLTKKNASSGRCSLTHYGYVTIFHFIRNIAMPDNVIIN